MSSKRQQLARVARLLDEAEGAPVSYVGLVKFMVMIRIIDVLKVDGYILEVVIDKACVESGITSYGHLVRARVWWEKTTSSDKFRDFGKMINSYHDLVAAIAEVELRPRVKRWIEETQEQFDPVVSDLPLKPEPARLSVR